MIIPNTLLCIIRVTRTWFHGRESAKLTVIQNNKKDAENKHDRGKMENARAVSGALRMPASRRIDVLHGMRLSIRDYRVSPSEQVRVRALPRSPWPIQASTSVRGESLHARAQVPSLLRYMHRYSKRDRYTPQIVVPRVQRRSRFLLSSDSEKKICFKTILAEKESDPEC